jgi:hypothetical protein
MLNFGFVLVRSAGAQSLTTGNAEIEFETKTRFTCQACGRRGAEDWQSAEAYA